MPTNNYFKVMSPPHGVRAATACVTFDDSSLEATARAYDIARQMAEEFDRHFPPKSGLPRRVVCWRSPVAWPFDRPRPKTVRDSVIGALAA